MDNSEVIFVNILLFQSNFLHTNYLRVLFFQQTIDHSKILLTSINISNLKQLFSFVIFEMTCCTQFVGDLFHGRQFRFSKYKLSASFAFSTKSSFLNSPNLNKILLFEVIVVFCYFVQILPYVHSMWRTYSMKKKFIIVSLLLFLKILSRSSYDVSITHYGVMPILFLFL